MAREKFHIDYSVPGASGYVATDDVNIGGAVVNKMPVGVATKIGPYFTGRSEDGIIGLGFKYGNSSKYFSFLIGDGKATILISRV